MNQILKCFHLEELLEEGPVLVHVGSLIQPMDGIGRSKRGRVDRRICVDESSDFYVDTLKNNPGNLFITKKCAEQYLMEKSCPKKGVLKRTRLIESFEKNKAIVSLEGKGAYDTLDEMYHYLLDKYSLRDYSYDLLISGICLSNRKGSAIIVSNSIKLLNALNEISSDTVVQNLQGFWRIHFDEFQRYYPEVIIKAYKV